MLHGEGVGGAVFLALYTINLGILIYGYVTRLIILKSVYSFLLFHVLLRLAAQAVAIKIGTLGNLDFGLLIAFFVLAAEGYFSLVLCAYRFLVSHHQHAYPIDGSWLEGRPTTRKKKDGTVGREVWYKRFRRAMTARDSQGNKDPWVMTIIHWVLIGANVIIINGGTRVNASDVGTDRYEDEMHTAKILRSTGQAIFLVINLFFAVFLYLTIRQDRSTSGTLPLGWTRFFRVKPDHGAIDAQNRHGSSRIDPTVKVLMVSWPPLIIRGIFGLLQALVDQVNYSHPEAYNYSDGKLTFSRTFVICENILSVLPEWFACCLLVSTMFTRGRTHRALEEECPMDGLERERGMSEATVNGESERKPSRLET